MFDLAVPPYQYADPWQLPLVDRLRMFRSERTKVAYYYRQPDSSTFRYRSFNMARALNDHAEGVSASWFWEGDAERLMSVAKEADVLVICRVPYSSQLANLIAVAKRFGARVFFDVDDYVFDISTVPDTVTTLDQFEADRTAAEHVWNGWFASFARMRTAMDLVDEIVVTNEFLAERTRTQFDRPVHVIPNFMGSEQIRYSKDLVAARDRHRARRDEALHVGYFSGTPTHNRDFAIVAGALARQFARRDDLRLRLVGFLDLNDSPLRAWTDRIDFVPLTNYMNLQRLIAETEINIAPLQDNDFTNCKSELKYFDAAAVAVPTIASPTFTMARAIEHGRNGLLARMGEWEDRLDEVLDDLPSAMSMGRRAYDHALAAYAPGNIVRRIIEVLGLADEPVVPDSGGEGE